MPPRQTLFELVYSVKQPSATPKKRKQTEVEALLSSQGRFEGSTRRHLLEEGLPMTSTPKRRKTEVPAPKKRETEVPAPKKRETEIEKLLRGQGLSDEAVHDYLRGARLPIGFPTSADSIERPVAGKNSRPVTGKSKMSVVGKGGSPVTDEKPFPFLRLPPELRNKVYGYAISGHVIRFMLLNFRRNLLLYPYRFQGGYPWDTPVPTFDLQKLSLAPKAARLTFGPDGLPTNWSEVYPQGASRILSLSLICRQITHETRLLPLSTNIFLFSHGVCPSLGEIMKTWNATQRSTVTVIAIGHWGIVDSMAHDEYAHYLRPGPLRTVFPALKRVYICPHPSWTKEQKPKVMEELADIMLVRGKGRDDGIELVLMDPRNLSVDIHDPDIIKVKVSLDPRN